MCYSSEWYQRSLTSEKSRKNREEAEARVRKAETAVKTDKSRPVLPEAEKQPALESELV